MNFNEYLRYLQLLDDLDTDSDSQGHLSFDHRFQNATSQDFHLGPTSPLEHTDYPQLDHTEANLSQEQLYTTLSSFQNSIYQVNPPVCQNFNILQFNLTSNNNHIETNTSTWAVPFHTSPDVHNSSSQDAYPAIFPTGPGFHGIEAEIQETKETQISHIPSVSYESLVIETEIQEPQKAKETGISPTSPTGYEFFGTEAQIQEAKETKEVLTSPLGNIQKQGERTLHFNRDPISLPRRKQRRIFMRVKNACVECNRARRRCSAGHPCARCERNGIICVSR